MDTQNENQDNNTNQNVPEVKAKELPPVTNPVTSAILNWLTSHEVMEAKVEEIEEKINLGGFKPNHQQIKESLEELTRLGVGRYIIGRRKHPSRFVMASADQEGEKGKGKKNPRLLRHSFHLRPGTVIRFELPKNLTQDEAKRLGQFLSTLPYIDIH